MVVKRYFGVSGIRGTFNKDLTNDLALRLGKAIGFYLYESGKIKDKIVISVDTRSVSSILANVITSGIASFGVNVEHVGVLSVAAAAYIAKAAGATLWIYVADLGSNYINDSIKIYDNNGELIDEQLEEILENLMSNNEILDEKVFHLTDIGRISYKNYDDEYVNFVTKKFKNSAIKKIKLAVSFSHGATCVLAKRILEKFVDIVPINNSPNGVNILSIYSNKEIDTLRRTIFDYDCDGGVAINVDGTAYVYIDQEGNIMDSEKIFSLFVLTDERFKRVVIKDELSLAVERYLIKKDIDVLRSKDSSRALYKQMKDNIILIGGFNDGSIIFLDYLPISDAIYNILKLLEITTRISSQEISKIIGKFPIYSVVYTNLEINESQRGEFNKNNKIKSFIANLLSTIAKDERVSVALQKDKNMIKIMAESKDKKRGLDVSYIVVNFIKKELNML